MLSNNFLFYVRSKTKVEKNQRQPEHTLAYKLETTARNRDYYSFHISFCLSLSLFHILILPLFLSSLRSRLFFSDLIFLVHLLFYFIPPFLFSVPQRRETHFEFTSRFIPQEDAREILASCCRARPLLWPLARRAFFSLSGVPAILKNGLYHHIFLLFLLSFFVEDCFIFTSSRPPFIVSGPLLLGPRIAYNFPVRCFFFH